MKISSKKSTPNRSLVKRSTYNQLIQLLHNKEFNELLFQEKEALKKIGGKQTVNFIVKCKKSIAKYLQDKKIPLSWIEPIYSFIENDEFDFPYENEITLKVGSDEMTTNKEEILLIRDLKSGVLLNDKKISIVIFAQISTDRIIQFIRQHSKEIEYWQRVLELPVYKSPIWHKTNLALKIIEMRDEQGMTFTSIADKFLEDQKLTDKEQNYYGDEDNIKSLYYRYKKRFSSLV